MLKNIKNNFDVVFISTFGMVYFIYLSVYQCLCLLLFCFEICLLYRILWDAEIKKADLTTLKYLSCSLHGQPER